MKLIALFLCFFSLNSFAEAKSTVKKTFDGGAAVCRDQVDVGSRAYNLQIASEKISGDTRYVTLNVIFYKCDEVVSGYGLRPSSPDEILHSFILLPDGKMGQTNNKLVAGSFAAISENGKVLSSDKVSENGGNFQVNLAFNKNLKHVFIEATLISNISSAVGNLDGVENK